MLTSDTPDAAQPISDCPSNLALCSTSTTPDNPSKRPNHCIGVTRSPRNRFARVEVSTGCRPGISAESPAGIDSEIATAVPPR